MRENPTLGSNAFERALAILNREQEANMPSRRQTTYFRLFNLIVYLFIGIGVVTIVGHGFGFHKEMMWLWGLQGIVLFLIIVLFFLNLGFVGKLKNQAKLRRQLRLDQNLKALFKAQRRETKVSNLWTLLISILGYPLVAIGLSGFVILLLVAVVDRDWGPLVGSAAGLGLTVLGLSFIFLHFMRRGKQRLELVDRLRATLSKYEDAFGQDGEQRVSIDADEYDQIARIERAHIIADRQRSIDQGLKEARTSGYLIQRSHEMQAAKAKLDPATAVLVENQILQLTTDPMPTGTAQHPDTGIFRLRVPETEVEILYKVDEDSRRIRVGKLLTSDSDDSSERASGE